MNVTLRPDRSLLDSNFESYKLGLTPIAVEKLPIPGGIHYLRAPDIISKQHIKAFTNQNCLNCSPYSPDTVFYIDANGSIIQLVIPGDVSGFGSSNVKFTFENWRQRQTLERKFYPTLSFSSPSCCCLYDGSGTLILLNTNFPSSCSWEFMATLQPPLVYTEAQLLDTLTVSSSSGTDQCLHLIFASVGERTTDVPVKSKSSMFVTYLEWLAYSSASASEWRLERHRRFVGTTFPDYVTLERDALALHICAERTFTLVYDSLRPITAAMNSGGHTAIDSSSGSENLASATQSNEHTPSQSPLLRWTQPSDEDMLQLCIEMDLNKFMLDADCMESVCVKVLPTLVDDKEDYRSLQVEFPAVSPDDVDRILFNEVLFGSVDPRLEFSLNRDRKSLLIKVTKKDEAFWPRVLLDVRANQQYAGPPQRSLCASEVEHLQGGPVAMSDDNENRGFVTIHPPFNIEQLEEVDFQDENADDNLLLQRIESENSKVTHQVYLSGHQWLFNVMSLRSDCFTQYANIAVCLRHDVDGIVWLPVPGKQQDNFRWKHTSTLQAFGYVLASKRDRRFVSCPLLFSDNDSTTAKTVANIPFVAVADSIKRIYIYRQPLPEREHGFGDGDTELRKRKPGGPDNDHRIVHVAWQHVVNLPEDGMIVGFVSLAQPYPACLACTKDNVYLISLKF